jgi:hypothetical protein
MDSKENNAMETSSRLHPLLTAAAISVSVFAAVGVGTLTGLVPHSIGSGKEVIEVPKQIAKPSPKPAAKPGSTPRAVLPAQIGTVLGAAGGDRVRVVDGRLQAV